MWWMGGAAVLLLFLIYLGVVSIGDKLHMLSNQLDAIKTEMTRLVTPLSDEAGARQEELDAIDREYGEREAARESSGK